MALPFDIMTVANFASDVLLGIGAAGAAIYCMVLARRLKRFSTLENGVGGAVAVLSAQVDDMTKTLEAARKAAEQSSKTLTDLNNRAEKSARKLELMMASLHDLPDDPSHSERSVSEAEQDNDWQAKAQEAMDPSVDQTPTFSTKRTASTEAA